MSKPAELRTPRLLLRPFQPGDVEEALAYRDDEEFARYLPHIPQPFTRADAEAFVRLNMTEPWDRSPTFAVVLEGRLIGTANLEVDPSARAAMLGYALGRAWWGRGYATEAARAVMAWAIESFGPRRVWASTDARNGRSIRVMEKLGLKRESVGAGGRGRGGEPTQSVTYALAVAPAPDARPPVPGTTPG